MKRMLLAAAITGSLAAVWYYNVESRIGLDAGYVPYAKMSTVGTRPGGAPVAHLPGASYVAAAMTPELGADRYCNDLGVAIARLKLPNVHGPLGKPDCVPMLVKFMNGYSLMLKEKEKSKAHKKAVACQKQYASYSDRDYGLYNEHTDLFMMGLCLIDKAHTAQR